MEEIFDNNSINMSLLVTPNMVNFSGVMHGGELLKLLDQVAYACASRYSGKSVVTLSVDRVLFKHPIKIGNLIHLLASINYTGNTSCEVGIKVISEDIQSRLVTHCNSSYFTMVAMENNRPCKIPQFRPTTKEQIRRFENAKTRKKLHKIHKE